MATTPEAKVKISADDSPLRQSLREMVNRMRGFGDEAKGGLERVNGPLEALRGRFIALTAIIGGGALFSAAVNEAAEFTDQSIQLGKALGVSAGDASTWVKALEDVGSTSEELRTANTGLLNSLRKNEDGLQAMGLKTRDAAGNLRPMNALMLESIDLVNRYAEGTDRQVAAAQIFGKGVQVNSALMKLNSDTVRENAEFMRELGLVVGQQHVEAYDRWDSAVDRTQMVLHGLRNAIGQALMPALTKVSEWFNTIGPAAVVVVRGAVGGLVSTFWALKNGVTVAWETINAMVFSVAEPLRALGAALWKMATGDFKGAAEELESIPARIGDAWRQAWREILASSEETRDRIAELFVDGPEAAAPKPGGRRASIDNKEDKASNASFMSTYEAALAEERRVFSILEDGREFTKEQELAFWRNIAQNLRLTAADKLAILRKTATLEADIYRAAAKERERLEQLSAKASREIALENVGGAERLKLSEIEAAASAARTLQDLGQITKANLAAQEVQFEQERYAIQAAALQERLRLLALDPNHNPVEMARLQNEVLLLQRQHQTRLAELQGNAAKEKGSFGGMLADAFGAEATWSNMLNGMLSQTMSWRQAMGSVFGGLRDIFVKTMVDGTVAPYVSSLAKMLLAKLGFSAQEQAVDATASAVKVGTKAAETGAVVAANAAQAGSGAAASQAGIPVVGPALALAAMAAIFAAVSALGTKSAAGGYDIPRGVNPLTQLHSEEMVLPSPLANAVRRMAEQGDQPAAAGGPPVVLGGVSAGDFFIANRRDLIKVLNGARRDFAYRS